MITHLFSRFFLWNWGKSDVNNAIFIASCIIEAIESEIEWPNSYAQVVMGEMPHGPEGVIGNMDNTLVKNRQPNKDHNHSRWLNGRIFFQNIYSIVIVDNIDCFIYVDLHDLGSFHNVTCL